ncbi:MAG: NAD(P)/FAD-dependent oxidoreductase [Gaiellales bacterium]
MAEIPGRAEVVVVGGGVMGVSALYHLSKLGCTDALLLERETLGSGSTSKAAGGIRAQFSDELNVRIAVECISRYQRFDEELSASIDYKQWGYLFLLTTEAEREMFAASLALQQSLGVPSRAVTPEEAAEIVPGLVTHDLVGGTFCPLDGYATPEAVVQGYARGAACLGAELRQGVAVEELVLRDGRVDGVMTDVGPVRAQTVVLCSGVWTRELASTIGVDVPVSGERRHVWFTAPGDDLRHELPLTIDFTSGFYFHREGNGVLFGGREPTIEELAPVATARLPALADLDVQGGWSGLYEMSPDHNAIVGRFGEPEGLFGATGFSGHGFQQGPVIGEHLAELALGLPPTFDLAPFSLERFGSGQARAELTVV